ncbi:MAG: hypothetical protein LBK62_05690 [Treponema sp.]|nr:hypothetical protein [Treponema sp.]
MHEVQQTPGRIFNFEIEGEQALGFDTGLDSRAFAQAKLALFMTEPGLIVRPDGVSPGGVETWKASGIVERAGPVQTNDERPGPTMVIRGPAFAGERLDLLINDSARQDEALRAAACWIQARLLLGESQASLRPFAALVSGGGTYLPGTVFFAPENLTLRCIQAEDADTRLSGGEWYVHPYLSGQGATAFTAAAMLYRVLAGTAPFPAQEEVVLHQDMREGNFPPIRLAAPGLDERLAVLIQKALSPTPGAEDAAGGGTVLLNQFLKILRPAGSACPGAAFFFHPLSAEERANLANKKEQFLKRKNLAIKTSRFVIRNTAIIAGAVAAILISILTARSFVKGRADLPTTRGMDSVQVIQGYYDAFGELDHQSLDARVTKGAGKSDIEMVLNLFVMTKVRQAYELQTAPLLISAAEWKASGGGASDSQVFGVTDLEIECLSGGETTDEIRYRAAYTLWLPVPQQEEESPDAEKSEPETEGRLPQGFQYTDELTLVRDRGNWRISEIKRAQR